MTDARLPERWLNDRRLQRLSAVHFRAFINVLLWSVANRTDGRIELDDLALVSHWTADAAAALVGAKLFTPLANGWLITDYDGTQSSRSELERLEKLRRRERENKAKQRGSDKASGKTSAQDTAASVNDGVPGTDLWTVPGGVPGTGPRDAPGRQEGRKAGKEDEQSDKASRAPCSNGCRRPSPINPDTGLCGYCELKLSKVPPDGSR